ncbi:hypothetical protein MnTg02_00336 [bacterium MnTg02]|nr:hypothetical protein MnTg02_00336 [bacterium MnTg02]
MTLKSMTGFARADGKLDSIRWHWEIRTLNSRGLDIRMRVPSGFDGLEQRVREACSNRLGRGNCSVSLNIKREAGLGELRLNENALREVVSALGQVEKIIQAKPARLDGILSLKGVLEYSEPEDNEELIAARREALLDSLAEALDDLIGARETEGARLHQAIANQIEQIGEIVAKIMSAPARQPDKIRERLQQQIRRLTSEDLGLDEARLHQEAMLLATKADIEEELERLKAHIASARELLDAKGPAGRRFEFLAQEFNREANTICSKSNDPELTNLGLSLKAVIDQMREQVQNIE